LAIQRALLAKPCGETPIRVRAAMQTGNAQERDSDYFGPPLNRVARLLGVVESQFEGFYKPLDTWDQAEFDRIADEVRHQLDKVTFQAPWSAGRELTLEQAITEAQQITP